MLPRLTRVHGPDAPVAGGTKTPLYSQPNLAVGKGPQVELPAWRNGRRDRLKICCPKGRGGSSPSAGTILKNREKSRFFRFQAPPRPKVTTKVTRSPPTSGDIRRHPATSDEVRAAWDRGYRYRSMLAVPRCRGPVFNREIAAPIACPFQSWNQPPYQAGSCLGTPQAPMLRTSKAKPHHS